MFQHDSLAKSPQYFLNKKLLSQTEKKTNTVQHHLYVESKKRN